MPTAVNLPAAAAGHNVVLRFRMGSDIGRPRTRAGESTRFCLRIQVRRRLHLHHLRRPGHRPRTRSTTSTTTLGFLLSSQNFEAASNAYDDELADDFVVPGGVSWTISTVDVAGEYFNGPGPANSVNVNFYANGGNNRPGSLLQSRPISRSQAALIS